MERGQGRVARFDQGLLLYRGEILGQRHQAGLVQIVAAARRFRRQPRIDGHRASQVLLALLQECGHPAQARRRRQRAHPRRRILLLQQREDRPAALADVDARVGLLEAQHAAEERRLLELGTEERGVDAVVLAPALDGQRLHGRQQRLDVLAALQHLRHRRIRQLVVPGVQALVAAADGVLPIAPGVVIARHGAQGGGIGRGSCQQRGDEREGHGSSRCEVGQASTARGVSGRRLRARTLVQRNDGSGSSKARGMARPIKGLSLLTARCQTLR